MKRSAVLGAVFALLATSVWAAPDTVLEKTEALESTVYGKVQVGALTDRVHQLQDTIYGTKQQGSITGQVESLYTSVEGQGTKVTLHQEVNALEWMYYDEVHKTPYGDNKWSIYLSYYFFNNLLYFFCAPFLVGFFL